MIKIRPFNTMVLNFVTLGREVVMRVNTQKEVLLYINKLSLLRLISLKSNHVRTYSRRLKGAQQTNCNDAVPVCSLAGAPRNPAISPIALCEIDSAYAERQEKLRACKKRACEKIIAL